MAENTFETLFISFRNPLPNKQNSSNNNGSPNGVRAGPRLIGYDQYRAVCDYHFKYRHTFRPDSSQDVRRFICLQCAGYGIANSSAVRRCRTESGSDGVKSAG